MNRGLRSLCRPPRLMALLMGLAGCSGGDAPPPLELQLAKAGRAVVAARTAPKTTRPPLTRAVLDTIDGALLEATLERRDQLAFLYVNGQVRDGTPGLVTTWRTQDDITLSTRNGVLIATRGLGEDMLTSAVPVAGDRPGPARGGEKVHDIRALDNKVVHLRLICELNDLGPETIEIVGQRHATRHLRETCVGGQAGDGRSAGRVINDYWVDSGITWQSRQWAGPGSGYLRLRRLIR